MLCVCVPGTWHAVLVADVWRDSQVSLIARERRGFVSRDVTRCKPYIYWYYRDVDGGGCRRPGKRGYEMCAAVVIPRPVYSSQTDHGMNFTLFAKNCVTRRGVCLAVGLTSRWQCSVLHHLGW